MENEQKIQDQLNDYLSSISKLKEEIEKKAEQIERLTKMEWKEVTIEGKRARTTITPDGKVLVHFEFKDDAEKFIAGLHD